MKKNPSILRWLSILILFLAALLAIFQLINFSRIRASFFPGTTIAGVDVSGLSRQQAAERLMLIYSLPVEVRYGDAAIQIKPSNVGFSLDLETMLAAADQARGSSSFWAGFWNYLWNQMPPATDVPLRASVSEERLRAYLINEIVPRYDQQPTAAMPVPGSTGFTPGKAGTKMDVDRAVILIQDALRSPTSRIVNLSYNTVEPPRPSLQTLGVQLRQVIDVSGFDGLTEVYLLDLQTNQEVQVARMNGADLTPDIAFTAASTMKIPIMISSFRRMGEPPPQEALDLMRAMIELSQNDPADQLMEDLMDKTLGPLQVTEDLQALGLENTFLAGYFYPGAPLLKRYTTPANSRTDVDTSPDDYNQTTPAEMGMLLNDLYQCASNGGGSFAAVFPGEISQSECRQMIDLLTKNLLPALIPAGIPEGTRIAHKHGWITELDGYVHTYSDAAIIYSPGGNYILVIYLYHPVQALWDEANQLMADLSQAVYNYYNTSLR